MKGEVKPCAWSGCKSRLQAKYEAELSVWGEAQDQKVDKPAVVFRLQGWLFCLQCVQVRDGVTMLKKSDKLWRTVQKLFHDHKRGTPRRESARLKWFYVNGTMRVPILSSASAEGLLEGGR